MALLVVAAAAALAVRAPQPPPTHGSDELPTPPGASPVAATTPASPLRSGLGHAIPGELLPAADTPVAEVIERLDARARSGDAAAACRIARELLRCRMALAWRSEQATQAAVNIVASDPDLDADAIAARSREIEAVIAHNRAVREACEALPAAQLRRTPIYTLAAARSGHVPSMVWFANAAGMGGEDIVADPQLYALYRAHAWPMFVAAFEAGHPDAVTAWWHALNSRGFAFLAGVLPDAWRSPGVAAALMTRLQQEAGRPPVVGLELTDADRERAEQLYDAHFAGSPWIEPAPPHPGPPTALPMRLELHDRACERVPG